MLEEAIATATQALVAEIKASAVYRDYETQLRNIKQDPELYKKVNEFRWKNYRLQTQEPPEGLLDKMDQFEREYAAIIENSQVSDFLRAELAFCRMTQRINETIALEVDFE